MAGSTSPYTFAGTLAQGIAENIALLCTTQIMNPGNPFAFLFAPSVTEMRKGRDLFYTIDKLLRKSASTEFAKRLGLVVHTETGGALNCRYDMQSGAEGMLMSLAAVLSGADMLAGSGSCLNANGLSSEFILSHYSFLDAALHLKNGYSLSDLGRVVASIREQGCGGNFLTDGLTVENLRQSEYFSHPLFDEAGESGDGIPMLERAHKEAEYIDESFVSPVPEDIAEALRRHFDKICTTLF
jgi:trimethylamine--corrinoid protein Co-methyltransferase